MLLSENSLKDVLGPRKKLLKAVDEKRKDMEEPEPEELEDSRL